MSTVLPRSFREQLELSEELRRGRDQMLEPQDLPGRFGRVIKAVDRVLGTLDCPAVLGGGWAVWRHGYIGRVTQDVDIVVPADRVDEFLRTAAVAGFDVLSTPPGRWPKVVHRETQITVDLLPEGGRPGTPAAPAPTTIPHPLTLGAAGARLAYIGLPELVGLKLAAGRARDDGDVVELVRANPGELSAIREHLTAMHFDYVRRFDALVQRARDQDAV